MTTGIPSKTLAMVQTAPRKLEAQELPIPQIGDDDGLIERIRIRLARGARWLMAWTMTGLCVAVLVVSLRAAGIALRGFGG